VALVVAVACVGLGFWQLRRLQDRRALNTTIAARRDAPPVDIDGGSSPTLPAFRRVVIHGTYDPEHEVLVYGASLDGAAGDLLVTPIVLADGSGVLIVRGWVPFAIDQAPVAEAAPAPGPVEIHGFVVEDEGDGTSRPDPKGVVPRLDVRGIAATLPFAVYPRAVQLAEQQPSKTTRLPVPMPAPSLSEGPHLSYAIQWFSFATIAVVGAIVLLRRDRRPRATP
jgi:surfeit locus 1 family protein